MTSNAGAFKLQPQKTNTMGFAVNEDKQIKQNAKKIRHGRSKKDNSSQNFSIVLMK